MVFGRGFFKLLTKDRRHKQVSILIIGLNNSGKSTIVSFFKNKDDRKTITVPTVGFNIEHFESESSGPFNLFALSYHHKFCISLIFSVPFLLIMPLKIFHNFMQIKESPSQPTTWLGSDAIEIYGSINSKHVME